LDVIVEYLDNNNQPVPVGEPGNLVLTRLHAGPSPLIRYRVGDVGISGGDRMPDSGRGFEILETVQGRDTDIIVTPSGNRLIVHFFTGLLEHYSEISSFQVVQKKTDEITLKVVPNKDFNSVVAERMINQLRERGADLTINLELVDEIPLTKGGKRRFVISEIRQPSN
jgi:phenylacetate-CoA ligase